MSVERQRAILEQQIDEIMMGISEAKREKAENFTIKQMEKTKKGLQAKIDKLNDQSRKDDVVTFEELGVDRIVPIFRGRTHSPVTWCSTRIIPMWASLAAGTQTENC